MSSLKKRMRPLVGMKSPVMALNSVVLRARVEPMTARRSLAAIFMLMSESATSAPKCRATLSSSSACAPDSCKRAATDTSDTATLFTEPLWAVRIVAAGSPEREEFRFRNAKCLVDLRNNLDELVVERSVRILGHFGQEFVGDGVAVFVERDLAGRRREHEAREGGAQLVAAVRHVGIDLLQAGQERGRVHIIAVREQRRRRECVRLLLVFSDELLPGRRLVVVGDRARRGRADDDVMDLTLRSEDRLIDRNGAADQRRLP